MLASKRRNASDAIPNLTAARPKLASFRQPHPRRPGSEGIWLRARSRTAPQPQQANLIPAPHEEKHQSAPINPETIRKPENVIAVAHKPRHKSASSALTRSEREEALAAKEQLMLALRVTTEKLTLIHRKPQNTNQIKNQHRVG